MCGDEPEKLRQYFFDARFLLWKNRDSGDAPINSLVASSIPNWTNIRFNRMKSNKQVATPFRCVILNTMLYTWTIIMRSEWMAFHGYISMIHGCRAIHKQLLCPRCGFMRVNRRHQEPVICNHTTGFRMQFEEYNITHHRPIIIISLIWYIAFIVSVYSIHQRIKLIQLIRHLEWQQ